MHRWHTANNASVASVDRKVVGLAQETKEAMTELKEIQKEDRDQSERRLASAFMSIGAQLLSATQRKELASLSLDQEHCSDIQSEGMNDMDFLISEPESPILKIPHDHNDHLTKNMRSKHTRLSDLWDEWHGEGRFQDPCGGIHGRDLKHGAKWRSHISDH